MIDDLGVPLPGVEEVEELLTRAGKETVHPDPGKEVVSLHMYSATNVKPGEEVTSLVALEMGRPPGKRRRVHEGARAAGGHGRGGGLPAHAVWRRSTMLAR